MSDILLIERTGRVETWTLNRPEASNALADGLVAELAKNVERVSSDRSLSAVVVTGAGERVFCAGADLKERRAMSEDEIRIFLGRMRAVFAAMESSEKIFIAAVNGFALGGGMELALACDLRVAAPGAKLGLTEVSLGIIPGAGGTQRLARLVGPGRAKDLALTARAVCADEALLFGLVNRIAQQRSALEEAHSLAREVAKNAPIALAAAKRAIARGADLSLDERLAVEMEQYERTMATKDRREGLEAFAQRRAPEFVGE